MLDQSPTSADALVRKPALQPAPIPVVLIAGDGIGPEVAEAARTVMSAACPSLDWIEADGGASVMAKGVATGLPTETLDAIQTAGVVLKGPLATPVGHGGKSANVTLRKMFELYGNIRPIRALPGVDGPYADRPIDFTIVRENVEDLYAGIEHMQTPDVAQCLKLITRSGSEKISRLAFDLAKAEGRSTVVCATKSNIMKLTEGLFQRSFETIATDYPTLDAQHMIVDNCAHQMVLNPEQFETIVTTNMNGDILSDLAAGLVGGLGLTPSANIGEGIAMFEAVHGSAPDIAGQGKANPTALILAGAMMLRHLGLSTIGARVETAVRVAYANGRDLPTDIARPGKAGSTSAFTDRILAVMETLPQDVGILNHRMDIGRSPTKAPAMVPAISRSFDGVDVFVEWHGNADTLADVIHATTANSSFGLTMISNRGTLMWPGTAPLADTVPHWRCRFMPADNSANPEDQIPLLLSALGARLRWMHVEKLERHDDVPAYSRAQGELSPKPERTLI